MITTTRLITRSALLLVVMLLSAASAGAQPSLAKRSVIVAIPDSFPSSEGRALVMRFSDPGKKDAIILNRANATPEGLGSALLVLQKLRAVKDTPAQDQVITISGFVPPSRLSETAASKLHGKLKKLLDEPSSRIGNIGRGHWVELPDVQIDS